MGGSPLSNVPGRLLVGKESFEKRLKTSNNDLCDLCSSRKPPDAKFNLELTKESGSLVIVARPPRHRLPNVTKRSLNPSRRPLQTYCAPLF